MATLEDMGTRTTLHRKLRGETTDRTKQGAHCRVQELERRGRGGGEKKGEGGMKGTGGGGDAGSSAHSVTKKCEALPRLHPVTCSGGGGERGRSRGGRGVSVGQTKHIGY